MTTAPVDELAQALRGTEQLVAAVRDEQWTRATPAPTGRSATWSTTSSEATACSPASSAGSSRRVCDTNLPRLEGSTIWATIR